MGNAAMWGICQYRCGADTSTHSLDEPQEGLCSCGAMAHKHYEGPTVATSIVFVERMSNNVSSSASTTDGWSSTDTSSRSKAKAMSMLQTPGLAVAIPPGKLDKDKLVAFTGSLRAAGIDTSKWGYGGAKSVEHLFWETYQQRGCVLTGSPEPGKMKRVTRLVKIRLVAEIFGVDHTLFSRMQFMHDGQTVERKQVPLRKLAWNLEANEATLEWRDDFYAEECPHTESWKDGCRKTLLERLGLSQAWQAQHLMEDVDGYKYTTEDNVKSDGYPGLNTLYCIHEVTFRVRDPEHPAVQGIGLPEGQEFATAEGEFNFNSQQDDSGLAIGTQLNIWTWSREMKVTVQKEASTFQSDRPLLPVAMKRVGDLLLIRRVPLPTSSAQLLRAMQTRLAGQHKKPPSGVLWAAMENLKTDWKLAKKMANKIIDVKYTLQDFNQDLAAFPELNLYLLEERTASVSSPINISSGRTIGDEYQRTIGAFFAIYWMMRVDVDGRDGFTNGVDEDWMPVKVTSKEDLEVTMPEKRMAFKENAKWDFFRKLLFDAGLLEEKKVGNFLTKTTKVVVNEKRLVSLLALTAIHDIMKMTVLLPEVQAEHSPYHGYKTGDTIGDHDHALSYIMDHYSEMLPSFKELDPTEQRSVQFTQCKLCFNHGWFVQAEAPPGAIFTQFREVLIRDHKSEIGRQDVALYFVHWLTDLAGAEPTPLAGCEKFVTKFPLPVLNSFLRSFEFVERIATQTETEVMEEYLKMRWAEHVPPVGPEPTGDSAIAKMRLLCMAQMNAPKVLQAFNELLDEDREVIATEMARTGCIGQRFSANLCPKEVSETLEGPAFLVYYGPAFLQNLGNDSALKRLSILAELYRSARELWPAQVSRVAVSVTIRIDMIKSLSVADIVGVCSNGDVWMMVKHNDSEAFVERSSKRKLNKMIASAQPFQVIDLSCLLAYV